MVTSAEAKVDLAVGSDLLKVAELSLQRKSGAPLWMEFAVNPDMEPFLVSSSRALLWVKPFAKGQAPRVRAAVRPIASRGALFREVLRAVVDLGRDAKWGNVHPLTSAGLLDAIGHLRGYDLPDLEILVSPGMPWGPRGLPSPIPVEETGGATLLGFPLFEAEWLAADTLVVVPADRDFVGFLLLVGPKGVSVVHNASRGIAVCVG